MAEETRGRRVHERWAHLRFSVIGQLLAAPPSEGELKAAIEGLAARTWRHPTTGEPVRIGFLNEATQAWVEHEYIFPSSSHRGYSINPSKFPGGRPIPSGSSSKRQQSNVRSIAFSGNPG